MTKSLAAPAQVVDKEVDAAVDGKEEVGDQGQHRAPSHLLEIHLRKVEISCGDSCGDHRTRTVLITQSQHISPSGPFQIAQKCSAPSSVCGK